MKKLLFVFLMLCPVCAVCQTQEIVTPPNDANKMHLSIVGDRNDSQFQQVLGWFNTNKDLVSIRSGVHYHVVYSDSVIFKERYAENVNGLPTVRLQNSDGVVIYERSSTKLPNTESILTIQLQFAYTVAPMRGCPFRRNPQPVEPEPPGPVEPTEPVFTQPQPQPPQDDGVSLANVLLLALLSSVSGFVSGVAYQWIKTHPLKKQ